MKVKIEKRYQKAHLKWMYIGANTENHWILEKTGKNNGKYMFQSKKRKWKGTADWNTLDSFIVR